MSGQKHRPPATAAAPSAASPPGAKHYDRAYLGPRLERLASYRLQCDLALRTGASSCLVVGVGDGIVIDLLRRTGMEVVTLDIVEELSPDLHGSVERIPSDDHRFEVSVCCQVLEHLPFERFAPCLRELRRVTSGSLVLSLPDVRRFAAVRATAGRFRVDRQWSLGPVRPRPIPRERAESMGHHWEIGFNGVRRRDVRRAIERSGWRLASTVRVYDLPWHCFFHCRADHGLEHGRSA